MTDTKKCLTPNEAAQRYSIPKGTLAQWRHNGIGPEYFAVSRKKVLYDVAAFESWLNRRKVTPSVLAAVEGQHGTL